MWSRRQVMISGTAFAGSLALFGARVFAIEEPTEGDGAGLSQFETPDGRRLEYFVGGPNGNRALVLHHGTPGSALEYLPWVKDAAAAGLRVVAYSRPGYGESARLAGREVAQATRDVAALLDHLGIETFVTAGWSGGGPHALACAALLPERCKRAATLAGVGPYGAEDLDFLAGMGPENVEEFGAAVRGAGPLATFMVENNPSMSSITGEELVAALGGLVSEPDKAALTGAFVDNLARAMRWGLQAGFDGWIDDDIAFTKPWGFDLGSIRVPVTLWQGRRDLMVPARHGKWLAQHVPGAQLRFEAAQGHISLVTTHRPKILDDLARP